MTSMSALTGERVLRERNLKLPPLEGWRLSKGHAWPRSGQSVHSSLLLQGLQRQHPFHVPGVWFLGTANTVLQARKLIQRLIPAKAHTAERGLGPQ